MAVGKWYDFHEFGWYMGNVGYNNNVTQWSRGEYTYANNQQDDLAILDGLLGPRPDDHSDVVAGATALYVDGAGTISVTNPETDPDTSCAPATL